MIILKFRANCDDIENLSVFVDKDIHLPFVVILSIRRRQVNYAVEVLLILCWAVNHICAD